MNKETKITLAVGIGLIVVFIIIGIFGNNSDGSTKTNSNSVKYSSVSNIEKTSDNQVYCTVVRAGGVVAPYDSSCRPCGDGRTHCTCRVSDSCESGMDGAFQLCKGYCIPN